MNSATSGPVPRHIIVADEDRAVVAFIIKTLREDGHAVFHAYDVLAATQLVFALDPCDLVLSNTKVEGADGVELVVQLRRRRPQVPIIYLANNGRSTQEIESQLPADVPILREPFTAEKLRAMVNEMLNGKAR
jgi:two-component system, cell cycle sensor histidine kinase and response regulator CckA